jgi:DNA-binding beta-propeller fold protein YncE
MKKIALALALCPVVLFAAYAKSMSGFALLQTFTMPDVPKGPYFDHLTADIPGNRLFTTPQAEKSVQVLDLNSGKLLHTISGIENPHSILYRRDLSRLYITDGGAGLLRIYDSNDYHQVKTINNLPDADSIGYDQTTKELYVTNGGESVKSDSSFLTVVDTTNGERVANIKIPAAALEAMTLENNGPHIYVNMMDQNKIAVVNRKTRTLVTTWPITRGKKPIAIALDEAHHRLFVGCRDTETSGVIVVVDTRTGKELETLPISGWVDYIAFDSNSRRIYASCGPPVAGGGTLYAFEEEGSKYSLLAKIDTAPRAKTALYLPELGKIFVAVPHYEDQARILVYKIP